MPRAKKSIRAEWISPFLLAIVAVAVALVAVWAIAKAHDRNEAVAASGPNLAMARRIQTMIEMQSGATRAFRLTRDMAFLENRNQFGARIDSMMDSMVSSQVTPEGARLAKRLRSQYARFDAKVRAVLQADGGGSGERNRSELLFRRAGPEKTRLEAYMADFSAYQETAHQAAIAEARAFEVHSIALVTITCILGLIVASALAIHLNRRLNRARRKADRFLAQLRVKEELLDSITHNASRALAFLDSRGLCSFLNPAAAQLTGYSPEEVLGKNLHDVLHPAREDEAHHPLSDCAIFKAVTTGRRQQGEDFILRKDGSAISIAFTSSPVLVEGRPLGVLIEAEDITRLKEAERRRDEYQQDLQRAKDNLSLAAKAGGIGIWDLDPAADTIHWSEGLWSMTGLPPDGPLKFDQVLAVVHPEDREKFMLGFEKAMDPSGSGEFELVHRVAKPDGSVRWFMNKGGASFVVSEGVKKLERFSGAAVDITDRKLTEEAMRASEERFQTLAKATNDAVYDWNIRTGTIWWNESINTLLGFRPGEEGRDLAWRTSRIHPEDKDTLARSLALALARDTRCWHSDYRFQCADGSYKNVFDRGFIIRDADGRSLRMIGAIMDVTSMRRAEEEIRKFRLLVDESNDFIAIADFAGKCEYMNAGGLRMSGAEAGGFGNGDILHFVAEREKEAAVKAWAEAVAKGQWQGEFRLRNRSTGRLVPVLWNIFAVKRPGGSAAVGMAVMGHDLTVLKEKEDQIRQGQKLEAIGHLAGGIAHDFNNILTIINGYGELLLERFPPEDPDRSLLTAMLESGRRAAHLTTQLLAYGRKQVLQLRVLDINGIVEETAGMLRRLISEDIELKLQLARPLEKVKADSAQVVQILLNLCLNARDAMAEGGEILMETAGVELEAGLQGRFSNLAPGRYVAISITDTGSGMPPEVQDHLFEPFFTTKPVGMGTGLGLSSVYGIIRQTGGGIEVRSEPGKGTMFRIYLPAEPAPVPDRNIPKAVQEAPAMAKGRVLLVEDEEAVRSITRKLLENAGYSVLEARDGVEALSLLQRMQPPPDLILTDAIMPRMGGPKLAEEVGRLRPNQRILFMSGYSEEAFPRSEGRRADPHILQKPFTSQSLLNAVQEAMEAQPVRD